MNTQRLCGPQGQPCKRNCGIDCHWNTAGTPHDIAARHFWEPNQAMHIDVYTGPSRLHRVLDWVERVGIPFALAVFIVGGLCFLWWLAWATGGGAR